MEESIGQRIQQRRKQMNLTQGELAGRIKGVTSAAISQWESDKTKPNAENLYELSVIFGCDFKWLLRGGDDRKILPYSAINTGNRIPVLNDSQFDLWDITQIPNIKETEFIMTELNVSKFAFAYIVEDDSMTPDFLEGDVIVFDPEISPLPGEFVAALDEEKGFFFRKFKLDEYKEENGTGVDFILTPLNEDYANLYSKIRKIKILGTMVEHRIYRRKR